MCAIPDLSSAITELAAAAARRRHKRPSARNFAVYHAVFVSGHEQSAVAERYSISQPRVSAICRQVRRWLSEHEPAERGETQGTGRKRVERHLARERYLTLYAYSLRFLERSQKELTTITRRFGDVQGAGGERSIRDDQHTERAQRAEAQWMRLAMRATDRLWELGELDEPQAGEGRGAAKQSSDTSALLEALSALRQEAARQGRIAGSDADSLADHRAAAAAMLAELLEQMPAEVASEVAGKEAAPEPTAEVETATSNAAVDEDVVAAAPGREDERCKCYELRANNSPTEAEEEQPWAAASGGGQTTCDEPPADWDAADDNELQRAEFSDITAPAEASPQLCADVA